MNLYDRVVIAYDKNLENFQMAIAIRGMLECYGLNVSLVWLNEKHNAIDFLAGHGGLTSVVQRIVVVGW